MAVFIGKLIKEITEGRGISKTELGRRLNMSPTNVHKIFKRETIDTGLLQKISAILEYDFFSHYTSTGKSYANNTESSTVSDSEAIYRKELELYNEKLLMLEKINALLEDKIKLLQKS